MFFLTSCYCNCFGRSGQALTHVIVCRDGDPVHFATLHVIHGTEVVVCNAGDHQAFLRHPFNCVVVSTSRHVPQHLTDHLAVLSGDVLRDAWLWKTGWC